MQAPIRKEAKKDYENTYCRVFETSKDVSGVVTVIDAGFNGHCIGVEAPSGESAAGTITKEYKMSESGIGV